MPKEIFCNIFSYISEDFEELFKCRQVCKSWNENIRDMIKLKRFRRHAAEKIKAKWSDEVFLPSEQEISFAKSLVKSGHLDEGVLVSGCYSAPVGRGRRATQSVSPKEVGDLCSWSNTI